MAKTYSDKQREYWALRPGDRAFFDTVEFHHPDFGYIRLVSNIYFDKDFNVDGVNQTFQAVAMEVPKITNQSTDNTQQGALMFGRIGIQFRRELMKITPLGAITSPISVTLRQYEDGITDPIYKRRLYVDKDGISIDADNVNVRLSVDNPAKLTNKAAFYDPSRWVGLQST